MSFRLKEATYRIRCREPGCVFVSDFVIKENIMGATEADMDTEVLKLARNSAYVKHDALFGRKHPLTNPDITKVSSSYDRIGVTAPAYAAPPVPTRTFRRGALIIRKGESAVTVCEVVRGVALNEKLPDLVYRAGATFGSAAIFRQKNRMADIVAGEDGTAIAFYDLRELRRTNPAKARELYDQAMEDIFHLLQYFEQYSQGLERKVKAGRARGRARPAAKKPAAKKKRAGAKKKPSRKPVARRTARR